MLNAAGRQPNSILFLKEKETDYCYANLHSLDNQHGTRGNKECKNQGLCEV